jgi:hypothetical protein
VPEERLTEILHIRVTPRTWQRVNRMACAKRCDISELLRGAIERATEKTGKTEPGTGAEKSRNSQNP